MTNDLAYITALVAGVAMLAAVCLVYIRTQTFGLGGVILSGFGVVLMGMSVWKSIDISLGEKGITAKLNRIEAVAERADKNADQAKAGVAKATASVMRLEENVIGVRAQLKLKDIGIYNGVADGVQGPATQAAIIRFQQEKGLPQTGALDDATTKALGIGP